VLNDGTGDRAFIQHISFGEDLSEVPAIVLGISGLDCTVYPVRVDVDAKGVSIRGLDVEIRTWGDTHVWSCVGPGMHIPRGAVRGANVDSSQSAHWIESRARVLALRNYSGVPVATGIRPLMTPIFSTRVGIFQTFV
jgi:H-type lectin domain-containing protein